MNLPPAEITPFTSLQEVVAHAHASLEPLVEEGVPASYTFTGGYRFLKWAMEYLASAEVYYRQAFVDMQAALEEGLRGSLPQREVVAVLQDYERYGLRQDTSPTLASLEGPIDGYLTLTEHLRTMDQTVSSWARFYREALEVLAHA